MTSRDFCYWLQGHFEISKTKALTSDQTEMVKRHLSLVFKHEIDPSFQDREELSGIHNPPQGIEAVVKALKKKTPRRNEPKYCERVDRDRPIMC